MAAPAVDVPTILKDGDLLDWVELRGLAADGSLRRDLPPQFTTQGGYSGNVEEDKSCLISAVATPSAILRGPALKVEGQDYPSADDPDSPLPVAHKVLAMGLGLGEWGDANADRNKKARAVAYGNVANADTAFATIYEKLRAGEAVAGEVRDLGAGDASDDFRVTLWFAETPAAPPEIGGAPLLLAGF